MMHGFRDTAHFLFSSHFGHQGLVSATRAQDTPKTYHIVPSSPKMSSVSLYDARFPRYGPLPV
jgi:hypothetical protein